MKKGYFLLFSLILSSLIDYGYASQLYFDGEVNDCGETLEKTKAGNLYRAQMHTFFCKEGTIAELAQDWNCETFHPRDLICKKGYWRCKTKYHCRPEDPKYNRKLISQHNPDY